jgi:hypothetical protein
MNMRQWFTLVAIAPQEDFLRLTPEEQLDLNDAMANRVEVLEEFMNKLTRGWGFIKSQHGNPS